MDFKKIIALDGHSSLMVNGLLVYSKYKPKVEVEKFIKSEIDLQAKGYLLVGLGLGYHLESIISLIGYSKKIKVLILDDTELHLFDTQKLFEEIPNNIEMILDYKNIGNLENYQVIIPNVWLQAIGINHPLYNSLQDIKMKQMSYKRFSSIMEENFNRNLDAKYFNLIGIKKEINHNKIACLVSAGPSLEETKDWLKIIRESLYILCVGSALKPLMKNGIIPDAVIISDCQLEIVNQLKDSGYKNQLFFLSTANFEAVQNFKGDKCILMQDGYESAVKYAEQFNYPLLETAGSVATLGFSLLEYLGFETVVLFGQDLGFYGNHTHVENSTSGRVISKGEKLLKIEANNGELISTVPNLFSYLNWFSTKANLSKCNIYNTAKKGAKIKGVPLILKLDFLNIV